MRTIVDIPEDQIKALDLIGKNQDVSRAELVRRAVDLYLAKEKKKTSADAIDQYFGFLKDYPEAFDGLDGVEYQEKIRAEWDGRDDMYANWGLHDQKSSDFDAILPDSIKKKEDK